MSTTTINLRLETVSGAQQLQWNNNGTWTKVTDTSPDTGLDEGDEIDWDGDATISKLKIKFKGQNIIKNNKITDNDSKKPKATVPSGIGRQTDSYTITVKPADGGPTGEYDPGIRVPSS